MFGLLSDIKSWIGLIIALWAWLALGAGLAFFGGLFRNWLGYAGIAVGGAIIMFLAITQHWITDSKNSQVKQLQIENRALKARQEILEATRAHLMKTLTEEAEVAKHNEKIVSDLKEQIENIPADCDCTVPKGFVDALKDLH